MRHHFNSGLFALSIKARSGEKSLRDVANEMDGAVSASTLSRLERGEWLDLRTLMIVCDWLNVSSSRFLTSDNEERTNVGMTDVAVYDSLIKIRSDVNFLVKIFQPSGEDS